MPFSDSFDHDFKALTGNDPFGWQRRLFGELLKGCFPPGLDIPTGLGKTAIIPVWLIALSCQSLDGPVRLPRRLVYVVDRRTVVDQATDVAERMRDRVADAGAVADGLRRLAGGGENLLSISTLRGEFADNRAWQEDPARAAIIVGTVDMIGSRLLFSGYGVTRKMRPVHAGLLGRDSLIVHDEAHLSPAFGSLVKGIAELQGDPAGEPRAMRVVELTATGRETEPGKLFALTADEMAAEPVRKRLRAPKEMTLDAPADAGNRPETLATAAAAFAERKVRVVVYVRTPKLAGEVAGLLGKTHKVDPNWIAILTGTIRGHERDNMTGDPKDIEAPDARRRAAVFSGFRSKEGRGPPEATEYLIATSAGEVGIDLDADHMVSDLSTLDSMIQRLGRVNRLGLGAAEVRVIDVREKDKGLDAEEASDLDRRLDATRDLLRSWMAEQGGRMDASPAALRDRIEVLKDDERRKCFSEQSEVAALTDVLLDTWAMTSLDGLPGALAVDRWLRGIRPSEPPSLHVAWRAEVEAIATGEKPAEAAKTMFERHRLLARERVRGRLRDVTDDLRRIARRVDECPAILVPVRGNPEVGRLADLLDDRRLAEATIVLPPGAGGLDESGMLDGSAKALVADVADIAEAERDGPPRKRRLRVILDRDADSGEWSARSLADEVALATKGQTVLRKAVWALREDPQAEAMAETGRIVLESDEDGGARLVLLTLARRGSPEAAEDSQEAAGREGVPVTVHNDEVAAEAKRIVAALGLEEPIASAVVTAAQLHDLGKDRDAWQRAIGHAPPWGDRGGWVAWAKGDRPGFDESACGDYRHEFGSLRDAAKHPAVTGHAERDLILHLIASHHGWARPHFEDGHFDMASGDDDNAAVAADAMRRYARLQARFGHWQLAWLESLVRAADRRVSAGKGGAA